MNKKGNNWTAYYDPDTGRYFAEIIYTSREGREQYDYEITQDMYNRLGTFKDDTDNERLIKTAKMAYSFENTMYGTLGPERTVWDDEAHEAMNTLTLTHRGTFPADSVTALQILLTQRWRYFFRASTKPERPPVRTNSAPAFFLTKQL